MEVMLQWRRKQKKEDTNIEETNSEGTNAEEANTAKEADRDGANS